MSVLLELKNLRYAWPGDPHPVIDLEYLGLDCGEKAFMFGPSGSGKSTLLALIAGLISPQRGQILFQNQELNALGGAGRDRFRAEHLGVIFQQFNLLPWLDLTGNVELPCRFSKARAARAGKVRRAAESLLASMGLAPGLWHRRSDSISVGQQQRVAAARALIGRPELILADEPTSALDHDRRVEFLDLLFRQVDAAQSTLLFVSHDRELADRFDRAIDLTRLNRAEAQA